MPKPPTKAQRHRVRAKTFIEVAAYAREGRNRYLNKAHIAEQLGEPTSLHLALAAEWEALEAWAEARAKEEADSV